MRQLLGTGVGFVKRVIEAVTGARLLEDGGYRLLEDGSYRLLEDIPENAILINGGDYLVDQDGNYIVWS